MKTETNSKFTYFEWQTPRIVPTLIKGKDALALFRTLEKDRKQFGENSGLDVVKYDEDSQEVYNSNLSLTGQIYRLITGSGLRVAVPSDDVNEDILRLIKGKYCTDFNSSVAQEKQPTYERNTGLWKKVIELAEQHSGKIKFPFRIDGFYVIPDSEEKGYGLTLVPAENFEVVEDGRFSSKYSGWKFNSVDEKGVPRDLDKARGSRTWYTREDGLSGVFLNRYSSLDAGGVDLACSYDDGRVVLVRAEGASQNFIQQRLRALKTARDTELSKVDNAYAQAEKAFYDSLRKK